MLHPDPSHVARFRHPHIWCPFAQLGTMPSANYEGPRYTVFSILRSKYFPQHPVPKLPQLPQSFKIMVLWHVTPVYFT